jgi:hypothetical protein
MAHIWPNAFSGILTIGFLTICGSEELTVYGRGCSICFSLANACEKTCKKGNRQADEAYRTLLISFTCASRQFLII